MRAAAPTPPTTVPPRLVQPVSGVRSHTALFVLSTRNSGAWLAAATAGPSMSEPPSDTADVHPVPALDASNSAWLVPWQAKKVTPDAACSAAAGAPVHAHGICLKPEPSVRV